MTASMASGDPPRQQLNSFQILGALKDVLPGTVMIVGRTGLPILMYPRTNDPATGECVGPLRIFYNLVPKQFRVVDDGNPKYEHRCGSAWELLDEVGSVLGCDFGEPPEILRDLR